MRLTIIVNPISGTGGRPDIARQRAVAAAAFLDARGLEGDVFVTEHGGHARELARAAVARGARLIVAWGGDGTINEVGCALAFGAVPLAIVPSGSGNGLARGLGIPLKPADAFAAAIAGRDRPIDAGEIDGHLFFNVAGIGLDARVARRFAEGGLAKRGVRRYVAVTLRELLAYRAAEYVITMESVSIRRRALMIVLANGRQYGNGAIIAPRARIDDGALDVVVIEQRSVVRALLQMPRVFSGAVDRVSGVSVHRAAEVTIAGEESMLYHADGEPFIGGAVIHARVHRHALMVRVPSTG